MHAEECTQRLCLILGKQSPQNKQIWRWHSYKVEIITLAEPHETITIKSFSCPLKIGNMLSLLIVSSLGRNMLKCADSQNSIWFIFSPHGYPVYMNIKHEMQLIGTGLSTLPSNDCVCMCVFSLLGFRFILIVSFYVSSKSFHVARGWNFMFIVVSGFGYFWKQMRRKYPKHFNSLSSKEVNSLLNLINRKNWDWP